MTTTIAFILAALWVIGVVTGMIHGGSIHLLLVVALALILIRFVRNRASTT